MSKEAQATKLRDLTGQFTGGRAVRGLFAIQKDDSLGPETPWPRRPRILEGKQRPGSILRRPLAAVGTLLGRAGNWPSLTDSGSLQPWTNERREELRRQSTSASGDGQESCQQFGPWESISGTLVRAVQPRSKTRFRNFLVVTDDSLFVLHVQSGLRLKSFANVGEVGWRIDRRQLAWTRDANAKLAANGFQLGFTDGSWMSVGADPVPGFPQFTGLFPETLPQTEQIPAFHITEENAPAR
ncbi:hypothetical protein HCC61_00230 [Streptomyces sp. HNM0575]|uniref:hypothetical protein n=1 Tax=Streptomyces sp. HNM0575 TaxID=2716338 RepID=UPI00145F40BE|nr:hypothetical protein [Streptomyces sp. HNM0575]NLU71146.1 hypothetical protein [Streptomyces sp. HNM0575]